MSNFVSYFRGYLQGIMNEESYITMAKSLDGNWFGINFSESPARIMSLTAQEVQEMLINLYDHVRKRKSLSGKFPHTYVHDRENPVFIKLYDPVKCGGSCSTIAPDPWWVFSMIQPHDHEIRELFPKIKVVLR